MTLLQELNQLKLFLISGVDREIAIKAFVDILCKYDSLYHFDEQAEDIVKVYYQRLFTDEEASVLNELRDELYSDSLFRYAVELSS